MSQLPIDEVMPSIFTQLAKYNQLILKAPPGAGKSTQLPLMLIKNNVIDGKIIMLEPRRLAARNIAQFLAKQLGESVGQTVGFRIRGESKVSANTKLEIVTEGVMTRLLQSDPELNGVGLLIFDEYHERSLHADTALAFALEIQEALRDDLKLLVMSATLDSDALKSLLPEARYVESEGRCYPVEYRYQALGANDRLVEKTAIQIQSLLNQESGSLLVFLPGAGEIRQVAERLTSLPDDVVLCSLYGQLSSSEQQQAIAPAPTGKRKVVLATNIAETSLTIEGIRLVLDCGYERVAKFDLKTGVTKLELVRIAQSSAEQRAGRAGRLESGICVRLYSQEQLQAQPLVPEPEILHSDLSSLALELVQWGASSPSDLMWLDTPTTASMNQARQLLQQLHLLDHRDQFTDVGKQAQQLGTEPRLAAMLVNAQQWGKEALQTALHVLPLLEQPPKGNQTDLSFQLNLLLEGRLSGHRQYLQRSQSFAAKLGVTLNHQSVTLHWLGTLLASAFPDRIAMQKGKNGRFQLSNGHGVELDEADPLADESSLVVVDLVRFKQGSSRVFSAAACTFSEIQEYLPHLFQEKEWLDWDDHKGQLLAEQRVTLGQLVIERKPMARPDPSLISQALLGYIRRKGLECLPWNKNSESLLIRIRCGAHWLPEQAWPAADESSLLADLEEWLLPFMNGITSAKGLASLDLMAALQAYLGWPLSKDIEEWLPTHYQLPTGTRATIRYQEKQAPVLAVRMQEMFGEKASPTVAMGKVGIVLELLSPAQRPLQITQDLAGFWAGSYKEVQKEMKGRYPKHVWPDDPANHEPTKKTKRHLK